MSWRLLGRGLGGLMIGLLLAANLLVGARLYSQEVRSGERDDAYSKMALFTRTMDQIRKHYVDGSKVSYSNLVYSALRGMLESLDPHSQFMDAQMFSDMMSDTAGQFAGLGIVVGVKDGVLTVIAPMEDTPAFRAGIVSGDQILEIDGKPTDGLDQENAVKYLRGPLGSKVTLKILRPGKREFKTITLERAEIKLASVKDGKILEDGIGYLRITQFSEPTAEALQKELDHLAGLGMKALVVDLRNNPGGLLVSAQEVAEKFLPRQAVIVSTEGRDPEDVQVLRAKGKVHLTNFPMAILINGGSASAAEIVAGALQDHKRAILLGEKSFGKGSVQTVLPMDEGTAIRLTTARYYTPHRRLIHEKGIEPDIVVPMSPAVWRRILAKTSLGVDLDEDVFGTDEEPQTFPPSAELKDTQLERAIDVLRGIMTFTKRHTDAASG